MLAKQKLITAADLENIQQGLKKILQQYQNGKYTLNFGDEDVHTRIENDLTKQFPKSGGKLHTGRSRNDQVLLDLRLYSKSQLINLTGQTLDLITAFCGQAQHYSSMPMPGMTHMQPAMLSSFGLWLGASGESLLDDLLLVEAAFTLNDQSPLGSGASYGVTLPLDREYTAKLLGFAKVQNNALYCQNSRGKIEAAVTHALLQIMASLNRFATDCLLFTTEPFSFITFDKSLSTGSSIMPQKQNWDALELLRANYHQLLAAGFQLNTSVSNLPSGYNRDLQQTKGNLMSAFEIVASSIEVASLFVKSLQVNEDQVKKHLPKEIFAAHWAYELMIKNDWPFRQAYQYVKDHLGQIPVFDPTKLLKQAVSQGSTGNLQLNRMQKNLADFRQRWAHKEKKFNQAIQNLI